jgi:glycine/D-amino acid oxidase-like deaminating enzyme
MPLFWFRNSDPRYTCDSGLPVYLFELPEGILYGFPQLDERGVKVAEHSGGAPVVDPLNVDRTLHAADEAKLTAFLEAHLPGVTHEVTDHTVCMYTMAPDERFLVDRHPRHANVVFAAGLSGHGFKFTAVLGEALAELAIEGRTDLPIGFLALNGPT